MYSSNIVNFQESTTILNACTKKSCNLLNTSRMYIYIPIYIFKYKYTYGYTHYICIHILYCLFYFLSDLLIRVSCSILRVYLCSELRLFLLPTTGSWWLNGSMPAAWVVTWLAALHFGPYWARRVVAGARSDQSAGHVKTKYIGFFWPRSSNCSRGKQVPKRILSLR